MFESESEWETRSGFGEKQSSSLLVLSTYIDDDRVVVFVDLSPVVGLLEQGEWPFDWQPELTIRRRFLDYVQLVLGQQMGGVLKFSDFYYQLSSKTT